LTNDLHSDLKRLHCDNTLNQSSALTPMEPSTIPLSLVGPGKHTPYSGAMLIENCHDVILEREA